MLTIFADRDPQKFWENWQKIVEKCGAGPRYLISNLEWFKSISKSRSLFFLDKSFICLNNGEPIAGVFLPVERNNEHLVASINGGYIPAPLLVDKEVDKEIFSLVDELCLENKVEKAMFSIDPLSDDSYNFLQKFGFLDSSILSYFFNLNDSKNLLQSCRRGHKCDIKKILNNENIKIFVVDSIYPSRELHNEFVIMHQKCAGNNAKTSEALAPLYNMLQSNQAVLFGMSDKGKNVAFTYFQYFKDKGIYTMAVDDPDYTGAPVYHALVYTAIEYLKKKGVVNIDTGQPSCSSMQYDYYPDDKQLKVALFKRGFPGNFKQNFRGVKYYTKNSFLIDANLFIGKYGK